MNGKPETLAQRREMLIKRCSLLREQLAVQRLELRQSLAPAQHVAHFAGQVRSHILPIAGLAVGLAIVRPKRLLSVAATATMAWETWNRFGPLLTLIARRLKKQ